MDGLMKRGRTTIPAKFPVFSCRCADTFVGLGIAVGMNKGHVVQRRELPPRPSRRKGYLSQKTKAVRSIIKEVVGYAITPPSLTRKDPVLLCEELLPMRSGLLNC